MTDTNYTKMHRPCSESSPAIDSGPSRSSTGTTIKSLSTNGNTIDDYTKFYAIQQAAINAWTQIPAPVHTTDRSDDCARSLESLRVTHAPARDRTGPRSSLPPPTVRSAPVDHAPPTQFPYLKGAGIIGYRFKNHRIKFLVMRKHSHKYDVFGGKIEAKHDCDAAATAAREFCEESSCEPYMYLNDIAVPDDTDERGYNRIFTQAQSYFEGLIRDKPNLIHHEESWGVFFVELPNIPVNVFPSTEDERLHNGSGERYVAQWIDIWELLDRSKQTNRMKCLNIQTGLEQIYRYDAEACKQRQRQSTKSTDGL